MASQPPPTVEDHPCLAVPIVPSSLVSSSSSAGLSGSRSTSSWPNLRHWRSTPPSHRRTAAVIHDFYGAVNSALRTGLPPNFTGILANDFFAHLDPPGLPPTREGLVARLQALGSTFPGIQLLPLNLSDDGGGTIVAEVSVEGATTGAFLGLPLAGDAVAWGPVDVFRIADGLIVELQGGRVDAPLLQPLVDLPIEVPVSALQSVALERVTVGAGSGFPAGSVLGFEAIHVEDGQVTIEIVENLGSLVRSSRAAPVMNESNRRTMRPGERAVLVAGDVLLLPQGAQAAGP